VLVLRMVFDFLQARNGKDEMEGITVEERRAYLDDTKVRLSALEDQIQDLWTWHAPNADGEQNWKNKRMITVLEQLNKTIGRNTEVIEDVRRLIEQNGKT